MAGCSESLDAFRFSPFRYYYTIFSLKTEAKTHNTMNTNLTDRAIIMPSNIIDTWLQSGMYVVAGQEKKGKAPKTDVATSKIKQDKNDKNKGFSVGWTWQVGLSRFGSLLV